MSCLILPVNKYMLCFLFFCCCGYSSGNAEIRNTNTLEWDSLWFSATPYQREKILLSICRKIYQPEVGDREIVLERLKAVQNLVQRTSWSPADLRIQKIIEQFIDTEVVLLEAAILMNLPDWCGTLVSKYLTGDNIAFSCAHQAFKINGYASYFMSFDPKRVRFGESIFVMPIYLDLFFDVYHPEIEFPFVLVTSNADNPMPAAFAPFLDDDKILAWFCSNPDGTSHSKLYPIPLGIRNHGYGREVFDFLDNVLLMYKHHKSFRKNLVYVNFTLHSGERQQLFDILKEKSWSTCASAKSQASYYEDLAQSKFVISPAGAGLDCWRTWEALLLGAFPIVKSSFLDSIFKDLPVVIVNEWSEITEQFLEDKYREFSALDFNYDKISVGYWAGVINQWIDQGK